MVEDPKVDQARHRARRLVRKRRALKRSIILLLCLSALAVAGLVWLILMQPSSSKNHSSKTTPHYQTALPKDHAISALGGWATPPNSPPVFTYTDQVGGATLHVSEQQLPASFKANPTSTVAQMATQFGATDKVTAGSTTVYIGTSVKGPQSVIFVKNNLLILVRTDKAIPDSAWQTYAANLTTSS